jgi:hypothetical protein
MMAIQAQVSTPIDGIVRDSTARTRKIMNKTRERIQSPPAGIIII